MKKHTFILLTLLAGAFIPAKNAIAYIWHGEDYTDFFGTALSISGDKVFVGAYNDESKPNVDGAAYIFDASTGEQNYKVYADDGEINDAFGYSAAIYGNIAVAAATRNSATAYWSGAVYVYDVASGEQTLKIQAEDVGRTARFGSSVAIYENTIVVGANGHAANGSNSGAAYIFDATTGEQKFKLLPDDGVANAQFGTASAIFKDTVVIGAQNYSSFTGAAYIFDAATGLQRFKIMAEDGAEGDSFGYSLDIHENTVIVGAGGHQQKIGAAYIFDAETGGQKFKFMADDGSAGDAFGQGVAMSGSTAIIGAYGNSEFAYGSGAAYIFDTGTGEQMLKITASGAQDNEWFGGTVDIDGDNFVVGASGKVYSGSVSSMTTLDDGTSKSTSGLSFRSNVDWIIGEGKSNNKVTLSAGDAADLATAGKSVYIGKNRGADNNVLIVEGTINVRVINVGSIGGNRENFIHFASTADYSAVTNINLTLGNGIIFDRIWTDYSDIFNFLGSIELMGYDTILGSWVVIDEDNYLKYLDFSRSSDGQLVGILIPEASTCAIAFGGLALIFAFVRRRKQRE